MFVCPGQKINKKSSITFSKNTKSQTRRRYMEILEFTQEAMNSKYLGLPVYMGRSKANIFEYLKERVWKCI
jgi:hypothetical protein